jgi:hypothetical protein
MILDHHELQREELKCDWEILELTENWTGK